MIPNIRSVVILTFLFFVMACASPPLAPKAISATDPAVKRLSPAVEQLRGLAFKRPVKTGKTNSSKVEKYVQSRLDEEYAPGEIELERKALVLLDLIPPDFAYEKFVVELLGEQVGGYYDPKKKALFISDKTPKKELELVLVHELTHALQDQHFGLKKFTERKRTRENDDQMLATNALIEGDAQMVMMSHAAQGQVITPEMVDMMMAALKSSFSVGQGEGRALATAPPFLKETLLFPYMEGLRFVAHVRKSGTWKGVNDIFSQPPESTEQILHPAAYGNVAEKPIRIESDTFASTISPPYRSQMTNVLGEFTLRLHLEAGGLSAEEAKKAAAGWAGDRFWLLTNQKPKGEGLLLATVWDTEKDAEEFRVGWLRRKAKPKSLLARKGKKVIISVHLDRSVMQASSNHWL